MAVLKQTSPPPPLHSPGSRGAPGSIPHLLPAYPRQESLCPAPPSASHPADTEGSPESQAPYRPPGPSSLTPSEPGVPAKEELSSETAQPRQRAHVMALHTRKGIFRPSRAPGGCALRQVSGCAGRGARPSVALVESPHVGNSCPARRPRSGGDAGNPETPDRWRRGKPGARPGARPAWTPVARPGAGFKPRPPRPARPLGRARISAPSPKGSAGPDPFPFPLPGLSPLERNILDSQSPASPRAAERRNAAPSRSGSRSPGTLAPPTPGTPNLSTQDLTLQLGFSVPHLCSCPCLPHAPSHYLGGCEARIAAPQGRGLGAAPVSLFPRGAAAGVPDLKPDHPREVFKLGFGLRPDVVRPRPQARESPCPARVNPESGSG